MCVQAAPSELLYSITSLKLQLGSATSCRARDAPPWRRSWLPSRAAAAGATRASSCTSQAHHFVDRLAAAVPEHMRQHALYALGWGAAHFSSSLRGIRPGAAKRFKRTLAADPRFKVVDVDESYSASYSTAYAYQPEVLQEIVSEAKGTVVRGLRWRANASYKNRSIFVSRDGNAAMNIRTCLMCGPGNRPVHLSHFPGRAKPVAAGWVTVRV
jgi:hypothetical protein